MDSFNFFRNPAYNSETKTSLWLSGFNDTHDSFCGCCKPIAHLLSVLFPEGHKDLDLTIRQILKRETEDNKCLFGGNEDPVGGGEDAGEGPSNAIDTKEEKEDLTEDQIEELIAAADAVEER